MSNQATGNFAHQPEVNPMNRDFQTPTVSAEWADSRQTAMAVAVAIHAIADSERSPDAIWGAPTRAEWEAVQSAVAEYVRHGDFEYDPAGYCWGCEIVRIDAPTFRIFVRTDEGTEFQAFTWCRDEASGIARAWREGREFGHNVTAVWAEAV